MIGGEDPTILYIPEVDEDAPGNHEQVVERDEQRHRLRHILERRREEAACGSLVLKPLNIIVIVLLDCWRHWTNQLKYYLSFTRYGIRAKEQ